MWTQLLILIMISKCLFGQDLEPVAAWHFDNVSQGTDISIFGANPMKMLGIFYGDGPNGQSNGAVWFPTVVGEQEMIVENPSSELQFLTNMTFITYVFIRSGRGPLFEYYRYFGNDRGLRFWVFSNPTDLLVEYQSGYRYVRNVIVINRWTQIALVIKSNLYEVYVDGILVYLDNANTDLAAQTHGRPLHIGTSLWHILDGRVACAAFYNQALDGQQISAMQLQCYGYNATCFSEVNITCRCNNGFTGQNCETDIDDCLLDPCDNNATCVDDVDNYTCICFDGFTGQNCETDIDDCMSDPCDNNASCVDAINNYTCICVDGFTGGNCETEIDDCISDPCDNNATCVDAIYNYTCLCVDGFTGGRCETDIDDCITDPCENNATCVDAVDNFSCNCVDGFTGRNCETDINECKSYPCQHGATCNDDINSYNCLCKEGWSGTHCEVDVDECLNGPCSNGGSCQNTPGSFKCTCAVTWAGTTCKIKLNEDPVVNSASPNKGPVAGGTRITVRGKHLPAGDPISVHIGTLDCVTTQQSETTVIAVTLPVNESDKSLVGIDLPMSVEISGGKVFKLTDTFLYKGNPKIESFRPRGTIVNGGTQITVSGEDLDAVAAPAVKIIVTYYKAISKDPIEYNVTTTNYEGPCEVKDVSEMRCETPEIELPEDFKIDKGPDTNSDGESRRKRSDDNIEYQDGDDRLTFYVGFALDGVKDFENFSSINVHPEPIFNFDYGDGNNVFQYKQGERLRFAGDSLDAGIMASDYRIDIGKAMCGSLELLSNSLSCKPPGEKPQLVASNPEPNPKIIINVGLNVQHFAGYLEYPDTEQLYIVIPASILSVIVIITIILTVCLLRRNRKRGKESTNKVKSFSVFEGHDDYPHYHEHHTSRYGREPTNRIIPRRSTIHPIFSDPYFMVVTNNRQHKDHEGLLGDDSFKDGDCVRSKGLPRQEIVENTASVDKYSRNQRLRQQPMFNNTRSATQYIRGQGLERQAGRDLNTNAQGLPRTDTMLRESHNVVQQSLDTNNALTRNHDIAEHHRHTNQNNRRGVVINDNVVAYQDIGLNNFVPSPPPPPPPPPPPAPPAPLMRRDAEFQSQLPNSPNDDRKEHTNRIIRWLSDDDFQN